VDEWGSEKELQRWSRATSWKPNLGSQGTIIRYTSVMIYSIAVLILPDFEGIGWKMPKGTRVDATVNNGARAVQHKVKKKKVTKKKSQDSGSIIDILKDGDKEDQQLVSLRIFFECCSAEEKRTARNALFQYIFPSSNNENSDNNESSNANEGGRELKQRKSTPSIVMWMTNPAVTVF
jgi:hypothetical protein